jgi:hypothetical protein
MTHSSVVDVYRDNNLGEPRMTAARGRPSEPFHGAIGFPPAPAPPGQHEERRLVHSEIPLEEKPPEFDLQKVPSVPEKKGHT